MTKSNVERPEDPTKELENGAINPFALAEAILGFKLN